MAKRSRKPKAPAAVRGGRATGGPTGTASKGPPAKKTVAKKKKKGTVGESRTSKRKAREYAEGKEYMLFREKVQGAENELPTWARCSGTAPCRTADSFTHR